MKKVVTFTRDFVGIILIAIGVELLGLGKKIAGDAFERRGLTEILPKPRPQQVMIIEGQATEHRSVH